MIQVAGAARPVQKAFRRAVGLRQEVRQRLLRQQPVNNGALLQRGQVFAGGARKVEQVHVFVIRHTRVAGRIEAVNFVGGSEQRRRGPHQVRG